MRGLAMAGATTAVVLGLLTFASPASALRLLYQSNYGEAGDVSGFTIASDGRLTPIPGSPFASVGPGLGLAIRHQFTPGSNAVPVVFQTHFASDQVSVFTVGSDGALSPAPGSPVAAGSGPISAAVSPNGRFLYVANHAGQSISAYNIANNGALTPIGPPFAVNGEAPWGLSVSPHGVLYAPLENSGSIAAMRIGSDGSLSHLPGSPFSVGTRDDQLTSSHVSIDGRFLLVTAGSGPREGVSNEGLWSFGLNADGTLSSRTPISRQRNGVPVGVRVAPNNRHVYVINKSNVVGQFHGSGGLSAYALGSNGSLTHVFGAEPPAFAGGTTPVGLDMLDQAPSFLYVAHEVTNNIGAFAVNDSNGSAAALGPPVQTPVGDAHFGTATTITGCSVVYRDGNSLRFRKRPSSLGVSMRVLVRGGLAAFAISRPRCVTPARGSGCVPVAGAASQVNCFMTNVNDVRVVLSEGNNSVATDDAFPETVFCSGNDSLTLDLQDTQIGTCNSTKAAVRVGRPVRLVGRSARVRGGVAFVRLRCGRNRQGGRCSGRLLIRRAGRVLGRATYSIRAGRRATVRVRITRGVRGRTRVRLLARERDRQGRPMTTNTALVLRRG